MTRKHFSLIKLVTALLVAFSPILACAESERLDAAVSDILTVMKFEGVPVLRKKLRSYPDGERRVDISAGQTNVLIQFDGNFIVTGVSRWSETVLPKIKNPEDSATKTRVTAKAIEYLRKITKSESAPSSKAMVRPNVNTGDGSKWVVEWSREVAGFKVFGDFVKIVLTEKEGLYGYVKVRDFPENLPKPKTRNGRRKLPRASLRKSCSGTGRSSEAAASKK